MPAWPGRPGLGGVSLWEDWDCVPVLRTSTAWKYLQAEAGQVHALPSETTNSSLHCL